MDSEQPDRELTAVSLSFRPDVRLVSAVRRFVTELCDSLLQDADAASRVGLTIHELLENTLKYSTDGHASVEVVVEDRKGQSLLRINSTSRAAPEQLEALRRRLDALKVLSDPMATYVAMMRQSAAEEDGSGLGLIRIRVEGEMDLTYSIEEDLITISATTPIAKGVLAIPEMRMPRPPGPGR